MITYSRLKSLLTYCRETGEFRWLVQRGWMKAGSLAGCEDQGYRVIAIDGRRYRAHVLAWMFVTGEWPSAIVDHKDRNGLNNKFLNLRLATHTQNQANRKTGSNNKLGLKGVYFVRDGRKKPYRVELAKDGNRRFVGYYATAEEATAAYAAAASEAFGAFARTE